LSIRASIIGATGYTGVELIRILSQHREVKISKIVSESKQEQSLASVFPHLSHIENIDFSSLDIDAIVQDSDIAFLALPHTAAAPIAEKLLKCGVKVIDLSADLRLKSGSLYTRWYNHEAPSDELLADAVYGLPEIGKREQIKKSNLIANPGCYPTASILAVTPLITNNLLDIGAGSLILDAKSGISGAGRKLSLNSHFCEVSNGFAAYQVGGIHRHIPEIEQELSILAKQQVSIMFTPHLIPIPRGLMVTAYCKLKTNVALSEVANLYKKYYQDSYFVRIRHDDANPTTKSVAGTNFCDISLYLDERNGYLVVVSVIDNLIKGASGQAVQNMNLMYGFAEQTGIEHIALYP
jgi:N-acetyl-gamma-glutamyl-phosphate reductase